MGQTCGCCRDDVKEKQQLEQLFKLSIAKWLTTVLVTRPEREAQVALAELVAACVTALGKHRVEAKTFLDSVVMSVKDMRVTNIWQSFLPRSDQIYADVRKTALLRAWLTFDKDNSGDLSFKELEALVDSLNFSESLSRKLLQKTKENAQGPGTLRQPTTEHQSMFDSKNTPFLNIHATFGQFQDAFNFISQFDELTSYWDEVHGTDPNPDISETKFGSFLRQVQNESNFQLEAKRLMAALNGNVTKDKFLAYLSSPELNSALDRVRASAVYHDMTQPLSHYFINCSHNTYLTGDQLTSNSSIDMYKIVLLDGVRCVELDCWDGPDPQHPVIYHGWTRTSKISFDETIDCINKHAFTTSEYPVVLSLELHVSPESQAHMVQKMKMTFGSQLATPTWPGGTGDPTVHISPEGYKRRIILKAKRAKGGPGDDDHHDDDSHLPEDIKKAKALSGSKHHSAIAPVMSDVIIMESCGFKGYDDQNAFHFQCCSIAEAKSAGMSTSHTAEYTAYNNRRITRVYPSGARMDSSNPDPQVHWNAGCSMIALNFQSIKDYEVRLNRGRFVDNNNCGYMLKPECLRKGMPSKTEYWTLEIISAFGLPKPMEGDSEIVDPYVKAFVEGPQQQKDKDFLKTSVVDDNGFHPIWKNEPTSIRTFKVPVPELSTMVLQIWDSDTTGMDDFLVECFLPCHLIRPGIRCCQLRNIKSQAMRDSCLIVRLSVSTAPPDKGAGSAAKLASVALARPMTPPSANLSGGEVPVPMDSSLL